MADLGPAWIGLRGAVVGDAITQVADSIRWARQRDERRRARRSTVLIAVLRHASDVSIQAADLASSYDAADAMGARAHVTLSHRSMKRFANSQQQSTSLVRSAPRA